MFLNTVFNHSDDIIITGRHVNIKRRLSLFRNYCLLDVSVIFYKYIYIFLLRYLELKLKRFMTHPYRDALIMV